MISTTQQAFVGAVYPSSYLITPGRDHTPTTSLLGGGSEAAATPAAASTGAVAYKIFIMLT